MEPITMHELRQECRAKEQTLLEYDRAVEAFAALLWPDELEQQERVTNLESVPELFDALSARVRAMQSWEIVQTLTARVRQAEERAQAAERRALEAERESAERGEWYEALSDVAAELKRERDEARDALRERGVCSMRGCAREPVVGEVCDLHAYEGSVIIDRCFYAGPPIEEKP